MINEINTWLNSSCNYYDGVELYKKYGTNKTLQSLFSNGPSHFTTKKLKEELFKINASEQSLSVHLIPSSTQSKPVNDYPEPVRSWYKEALGLLDLNKDRKTKLGLLVEMALEKFNPSKDMHKLNQWLLSQGTEELVHEHLEGCFQEGKLWEKISIWRKTGKLPEVEKEIPFEIKLMDLHNLMLRRNVLRSRISQCKKRKPSRNFTKEARAEFRAKNKKMLMEYQEELDLILIRYNELI